MVEDPLPVWCGFWLIPGSKVSEKAHPVSGRLLLADAVRVEIAHALIIAQSRAPDLTTT
ncbi:hypothetical protein OG884_05875 [Streptosporangium sp. NBC_01755]|uniref:hypothetical protein n=1 Tax=Streptosporangium sp. NBC_01755 TaxID=2975949 RepID=UPI002DD8F02E|nr:hypothetical protein [Streptosporangium sp. NBC_01755]WSD01454.1 hypothetical protein OG884_05875 [Streptosporangium sp. NBC_01755]